MAVPQKYQRLKYWLTNTNRYFLRFGNETKEGALIRYLANPSIGIESPTGERWDGGIDSHNVNNIIGWAIDPTDDNFSPTVAIWVNGVIVARIVCDIVRVDIADRFNITTWNKYGFNYSVPAEYNNPSNIIRVTLYDRTDDLQYSPTQLAPLTTTTTTALPVGFYNRVLVLGNSITHNRWSGKDWGMDASSPANDWYHIYSGYLHAQNPSVIVKELGDFPEMAYGIVEGPHWENYYYRMNDESLDIARGGLSRYAPVAAFKPDLIVWRLGENITIYQDLVFHMKAFIDTLKAQNLNCTVVLATPMWNKPEVAAALQAIATERNYNIALLNGITGSTSGEAGHPNNAAMLESAVRIWAVTPKLTTTTTTVTTTAVTTVIPSDYLAYSNDNTLPSLVSFETSDTQLKFHGGLGGIISYARQKNKARNMVNTPLIGGEEDGGRSIQWSWYCSPYGDYTANGQTAYAATGGTGANPVQGSSIWPNLDPGIVYKRRIVSTVDRGDVYCQQVRGMLWYFNNVPGHILMNQELWWKNSRTLEWRMEVIVEERNPATIPEQRTYRGFAQESPCVYGIGDLYRRIGIVNGQTVEKTAIGGGHIDELTDDKAYGLYSADLSEGMTLFMPRCRVFASNLIHGQGGGEHDNNCSYMQSKQRISLENAGVYHNSGFIIFGSRANALSIIPTLPQPSLPFSFDFTGNRHDWDNGDCMMRRENGLLVLYIGTPNQDNNAYNTAGALSPTWSWEASTINKVNIRMAVTDNATQVNFRWFKRNISTGQLDGYNKVFNVIGDGIERNYVIDMNGVSGWSGEIWQVGLGGINGMPFGTKLILKTLQIG